MFPDLIKINEFTEVLINIQNMVVLTCDCKLWYSESYLDLHVSNCQVFIKTGAIIAVVMFKRPTI